MSEGRGKIIYSSDEVVIRHKLKKDQHQVTIHRRREDDSYEILPLAYMLGHNILLFDRKVQDDS